MAHKEDEPHTHTHREAGAKSEEESCLGLQGSNPALPSLATIAQDSLEPDAKPPVLLMLESTSVIFHHVVMHRTAFPESLSLVCDVRWATSCHLGPTCSCLLSPWLGSARQR